MTVAMYFERHANGYKLWQHHASQVRQGSGLSAVWSADKVRMKRESGPAQAAPCIPLTAEIADLQHTRTFWLWS